MCDVGIGYILYVYKCVVYTIFYNIHDDDDAMTTRNMRGVCCRMIFSENSVCFSYSQCEEGLLNIIQIACGFPFKLFSKIKKKIGNFLCVVKS